MELTEAEKVELEKNKQLEANNKQKKQQQQDSQSQNQIGKEGDQATDPGTKKKKKRELKKRKKRLKRLKLYQLLIGKSPRRNSMHQRKLMRFLEYQKDGHNLLNSRYPPNQIHQYKVPRVKNQQLKAKEGKIQQHLQFLRKGAEIQRQVRRFAQKIIRPGRKLIDICQQLQNYNRQLCPEKGLQSGIGFPTGCSLNHVAAHYTPNPGDNTVLGYDDVCKIDFGSHINGRIIDCAFTVAFNPTYDKLLEAVKDATNTGLKQAGIDVRICDIGQRIQQTMESYEVQIKGKVYPVKVVKNLNGHSIEPYKIHGGKTIPCIKNNSNVKMQEGQYYAIETFGSTGKGFVREDGQCSHYMKDFYLPANVKIPNRSKPLYNIITDKFSTLAFCKRWLERMEIPTYILPLRDLVQNGIINPYPPLCDVEGSYVAQWQHTFILRPECKQILSRGEDF